ncbi:MAG TPA: hypothetical protein VGE74_11030 [Gemmata sp.]
MSKRHILRFESKREALLPRHAFARRVARNFAAASALVGVSLLGGMLGYHLTEDMGWVDAFANAAMILSGMGPLEPLKTPGGKVFAGAYALDSGLVLVLASGVVLALIIHRMVHRFHLEEEGAQ